MQSVESEGDSIDEAISGALRLLQVGRERVEIEILCDATPGVFRLGRRRARVRATLRAPLWEESGPTRAVEDVSRETGGAGIHAVPTSSFEDRCTGLVRDLSAHIGVSCPVTSRPGPEPGTLIVEAGGVGSGLLIGRRGQTLDAIEYLVNRMAGRGEEGEVGRVIVDIEGYRGRRQEYLEATARRLADKAKQTGRVVTLNPMSSRDRRIVHLTLQDDPGVETRSEGEGYYRRLLIVPSTNSARRSRSGSPSR